MKYALNVLIAEDDLMMADLLEAILTTHGHHICGISRSVDYAIALGAIFRPDLAIIDVRLADGGHGADIANALSGLSEMAVLYATGNPSEVLATGAAGQGCIVKPYYSQDLMRSIEIVSQLVATGQATGPVPRNFHFLRPSPPAQTMQ